MKVSTSEYGIRFDDLTLDVHNVKNYSGYALEIPIHNQGFYVMAMVKHNEYGDSIVVFKSKEMLDEYLELEDSINLVKIINIED